MMMSSIMGIIVTKTETVLRGDSMDRCNRDDVLKQDSPAPAPQLSPASVDQSSDISNIADRIKSIRGEHRKVSSPQFAQAELLGEYCITTTMKYIGNIEGKFSLSHFDLCPSALIKEYDVDQTKRVGVRQAITEE